MAFLFRFLLLLTLANLSQCSFPDPNPSSINASEDARSDLPDDIFLRELSLRTAKQINATMSGLTGIDKYHPAITALMTQIQDQLPLNRDINSFSSASQVGITRLALAYCHELMNDSKKRQQVFGNINFEAPSSQLFNETNIEMISSIMIESFWLSSPQMPGSEGNLGKAILIDLINSLKGEAKDKVDYFPFVHDLLEAENGKISGSFAREKSVDATFVVSPEGGIKREPNDNASGIIELNFTIKTDGTYQILGLVRPETYDRNSFYVSIDGGDFLTWGIEPLSNDWVWSSVNRNNGSDTVILNLKKGVHKLVIKEREDGTMLDKIAIMENVPGKIDQLKNLNIAKTAQLSSQGVFEAACASSLSSSQVSFF